MKHLFFSMMILFFVGCSIHLDDRKNIEGFSLQRNALPQQNVQSEFSEHMDDTGQSNFDLLKARYGDTEWLLNRNDKNQPPLIGIAMSGGGMRSASFNIGVLKGLNRLKMNNGENLLDQIDIMSSVSGGCYAMSWYYLQKYYSNDDDNLLFDPNGIYQQHLLKHTRMPIHSDQAIIEYPEYIAKAASNFISLPLHWLANGLFDWNANLAPYRLYYQNAIERAFHISPCASPECAPFRNDSTFFGILVGVKAEDEVNFSDMRRFLLDDASLPSFIINTTVKIDADDLEHRAGEFCSSIFEFTPFQYGSDSFGYREDFPVDIHTAVSISGAAVDSSILPQKARGLNDILNLNLGYSIPNRNIKSEQRNKHNALPFPFYYAYRDKYDIRGSSIYLTDGGHSDNLGVFSLIKRMCRNIIIVDAEHDPKYEFKSYWKLKKRLKNEFGVTLQVDSIESQEKWEFDLLKNKQIYDNELSDEMIEVLGLKGSDNFKVTYLESIGNIWSIEDEILKKYFLAAKKSGKLIVTSKYRGVKPVFHGSVSWFPIKNDKNLVSEKKELHIIYVKLSLKIEEDGSICSDYPESVKKYYNDKGNDKKKFFFLKADSFPHENTSDVSYGKDQYKAYRDLGEHFILTNQGCFREMEKCKDYKKANLF